jgi:CRP-like cAMP-binding protein
MALTANAASLWLFPAILAALVLAAAWVGVRWYYAEYLESLAEVPLFRSLGARRLRSLARSAAREDVAPGARIVAEGERADGVYVLEKGSATVTVLGETKATLGPGGYFGEMAVIDRRPRSATITAGAPTTVLRLPSSAFHALVSRDRSIATAIDAELTRRLRESGTPVPDGAGAEGSIERLEALSLALRSVQPVDWGTGPPPRRRRWFGG